MAADCGFYLDKHKRQNRQQGMQIKDPLAVPRPAIELVRINPNYLPDDIAQQSTKLRQTRTCRHQDDKDQADQCFIKGEAFLKEKSDKDWQNCQNDIDKVNWIAVGFQVRQLFQEIHHRLLTSLISPLMSILPFGVRGRVSR